MGELLEVTNDQVLGEIGKDYGKNIVVPGVRLVSTLQPVVVAADYRRVWRTTRENESMDGVDTTLTLTYETPSGESRRYTHVRIGSGLTGDLTVVGTIQRNTSSRLLQEVVRANVAGTLLAYVVGKFERFVVATGSGQSFAEEIIQPQDSTLAFKITARTGGPILIGTVLFETGYWEEPPLRAWLSGRPTSIEKA